MKKVCFYTESIFDLGGIQRVVTTLANNLYMDYELTILCSHVVSKNKSVNYNLNENINVEYLPKVNFVFSTYNFIFKFVRFIYRDLLKLSKTSKLFSYINFKSRLNTVNSLKKYINNNHFDYVIAEGLTCCIYLSLIRNKIKSNIKFIGCWHSSYDRYISDYPKNSIIDSLKKNDLTVVLSKHDKDLIKSNLGFETTYIYNPITKYNNIKSQKEKKFLAVGRYNKIKGYDKLIDAFYLFYKKNKDWKLEIVGDGEEKKRLQELIDNYGLSNQIKLTGKTDDVSTYYNSAEAFLMTSKFEGLPMVLLEAMQHKLPILAFDIPIVHEILPSKVPIIPQDNVKMFADKMYELSINKNNIKNMTEDYDIKLEDFYIDNILKKWKDILK